MIYRQISVALINSTIITGIIISLILQYVGYLYTTLFKAMQENITVNSILTTETLTSINKLGLVVNTSHKLVIMGHCKKYKDYTFPIKKNKVKIEIFLLTYIITMFTFQNVVIVIFEYIPLDSDV